jgi:OmpA-OmpF porin, OOP family
MTGIARVATAIALMIVAAGAPVQAQGAAGAPQPNFKTAKIEFVPGERTVFFDDFSDMAEGEPPPHWKVRGGKVELWKAGALRELKPGDGVEMTSPKFALPRNFTFELVWTGGGEMIWSFKDKDENDLLTALIRGEEDGKTASTTVGAATGDLGNGSIETDTNQPVRFELWAQQGRVRAYLNGERLVDANQVEFGQIDHILVQPSRYRLSGIRSVRIAESAPDFSTVLGASGKYVTHGIYFDTDSDRLRPESAPVLRMVAAALDKNPVLKLEIDGYTDAVGQAAHNLDLSKRRAEAVKAVLVSQFGCDAGRLTTAGLGATKPIASNDTPQGRADNRRVEFIKQ